MSRSIVLIGMMGSGKTDVGFCLSKLIGYPLVDSDTEIESKEGSSIPDIFASKGEAYFRQKESDWLNTVAPTAPMIIATGGGLITLNNAKNLLKNLGWVVWLHAAPYVLYERLGTSTNRPLFLTKNPLKTLSDLLTSRQPLYTNACDFIINTEKKSCETVASLIVTRWKDTHDHLG